MEYPLERLAPGDIYSGSAIQTQAIAAMRSAHKAMLTGYAENPVNYGVVESGAARLHITRMSVDLLKEKAGGVLGAVMAKKSARWTSSR
jgi:hypothetical protein